MNVVFLHIPKTAGQAVHHALEEAFGSDQIFPAREGADALSFPLSAYSQYRVFSGHLDWCRLDCVPDPKVVFTILRDPFERLLSFYLFLRQQGSELTAAEAEQRPGVGRAYHWSPDEYFLSDRDPAFRNFISNHYDNLYTHYFAHRSFAGRDALAHLRHPGQPLASDDALIGLALDNLRCLDMVVPMHECGRVPHLLARHFGIPVEDAELPHHNVNEIPREHRLELLRRLGASDETLDYMQECCRLDEQLMARLFVDGTTVLRTR